MGYDLSSIKGRSSTHFNINGWGYVTKLATEYGWNPMGTVYKSFKATDISDGKIITIKSIPEWEGTYFSNDGQVVTAKDAKGMKKALEKALVYEEKYIGEDNKYWIPKLKEFIKFLDNGAFRIL